MKSLTLEQTADLLQVTKRSVYNYIKNGALETFTVGESQRIVVDAMLEEQLAKRPDILPAERHGPPASA